MKFNRQYLMPFITGVVSLVVLTMLLFGADPSKICKLAVMIPGANVTVCTVETPKTVSTSTDAQ
jgi:PP-loop superfamily ATP-utilizing enzyme